MTRDRIQNTVEFVHNGNKIEGTLFTYFYEGSEKTQTFMFLYKENNIHISLDEEQDYYNVAPLHCEIIDKLGIKGHKSYEEYLSTIQSIGRNHIIINDKVYNYYSKLLIQSPKVYALSLMLEDGTYLDGTYKLTTIDERSRKNELFNNLQTQAHYAFKQNKIEPSQEQLNNEKTNEYQQAKNSIKEILESL